ncbi:hypothetical protein A2U01_0084265, partial [Trifolium medium]|nr:hypothetical protein [Trifolium medium]
IPNKGDASAAGGDAGETVQPSPKKRKGPTVHKGRTVPLLHGLGVAQPSSSYTAPAATSSAAPSLWDLLFNPMEFIERELNMVGNISR